MPINPIIGIGDSIHEPFDHSWHLHSLAPTLVAHGPREWVDTDRLPKEKRRGISIEVLRERYADQDSIGIKGTERIDINCHGVGDTSTAGPIVALIGG